MSAKPFSDEELKEWRKQPAHGDERRFLATITARDKRIEELESEVAFWDRVNERQYDKWIQLSKFWQKAENKPNTLPDRMKLLEWLIQHIQTGVETFLTQTATIDADRQRFADLEEKHKRMCGNLQEIVQKYQLGLGGEKIDELVCGQFETDRQQIENLKLDLHIANRALEIDPATVDLRIRIAELEKQAKIKDSLAEGVMMLAEVYEQLEDAKAENRTLVVENRAMLYTIKRLREIESKARDVVSAFDSNSGYGVLIGPTGRLRQVLRPQKGNKEDVKAENQRLRDLLLEAIKWVDKHDWNQARGLEYKLKQALRPQEEEPCEK